MVVMVGLVAGTLTTLAFVPQLARVYRRKSAKDLSYGYLLSFATGVFLWLLYGLFTHDMPIIIANAVTLALVLALVIMKVGYGKR
jgi:MtN3 and saliva related transmembrane protein